MRIVSSIMPFKWRACYKSVFTLIKPNIWRVPARNGGLFICIFFVTTISDRFTVKWIPLLK